MLIYDHSMHGAVEQCVPGRAVEQFVPGRAVDQCVPGRAVEQFVPGRAVGGRMCPVCSCMLIYDDIC